MRAPRNPSSDPPSQNAARSWQIRGRTLSLGRLPLLMGVVNVTPDSFSDGGRWLEPAVAVEHALAMVAEGAEILDVGGESTRPGAEPVDADEEIGRVLPVVEKLAAATEIPISIDTSKAVVAREAIAAGAHIVNDVTALENDRAMLEVVLESGSGLCAMHMQGTPQTMQLHPVYDDVVAEVIAYLRRRRDFLVAAGVAPQQIALDPGLGFGKTTAHNLQLIRAAGQLHALGCPVLFGPSRKRFIGEVQGAPQGDRMPGTIGVALALARQGVQILRVHDAAAVHRALRSFEASGGLDG